MGSEGSQSGKSQAGFQEGFACSHLMVVVPNRQWMLLRHIGRHALRFLVINRLETRNKLERRPPGTICSFFQLFGKQCLQI